MQGDRYLIEADFVLKKVKDLGLLAEDVGHDLKQTARAQPLAEGALNDWAFRRVKSPFPQISTKIDFWWHKGKNQFRSYYAHR